MFLEIDNEKRRAGAAMPCGKSQKEVGLLRGKGKKGRARGLPNIIQRPSTEETAPGSQTAEVSFDGGRRP